MGACLRHSVGQVHILLALPPGRRTVEVPEDGDVAVVVLGAPVVDKELSPEIETSSIRVDLAKTSREQVKVVKTSSHLIIPDS